MDRPYGQLSLIRHLVIAHPMLSARHLDSMCRALQWVGTPNDTRYILHVSSLVADPNSPELASWVEQGHLVFYPMLDAPRWLALLGHAHVVNEENPITLADRLSWTYVDICVALETKGIQQAWLSKWGVIPLDYNGFERALYTHRVIGELTMDSSCRECMKQHYASQINVVEYARAHQKPTLDHDWGAPLLTNVGTFVELAVGASLRCFDPLNLYANWYPHDYNLRSVSPGDPRVLRLVSPSLITSWQLNGRALDHAMVAVDCRLWPAALDMALTAHFA